MKLNEILLIGGALIAALVLSKGRGLSSTNSTIPFINPFSNLLDQAQAQAVQKLKSNIGTLESVRQSNLGIAQSILGYERSLADVNISQIKTELDKTQSYIGALQKRAQFTPKYGVNIEQAKYINQFGISAAYKRWQDPKIKQIANIRQAQSFIPIAIDFSQKQQTKIDRLEEEYQTRFGGLSRYG